MRAIFLISLALLASISLGTLSEAEEKTMTITILYDNNPYDENLRPDWGFSCLIEGLRETILFDTGASGEILMSNIKKLGVNPQDIDTIFISHNHYDHVGGLWDFLKANNEVKVYFGESYPESFKEKVRQAGAEPISIGSSNQIYPDVYSTGEMGLMIKEQALVIKRDKGSVLITGCAHPGIVKVAKIAKEISKNKLSLVLGGFHLFGAGDREVRKIVTQFREMEVEKVAPCHCSGDKARSLFEEEYKENFIRVGVGKKIKGDGLLIEN